MKVRVLMVFTVFLYSGCVCVGFNPVGDIDGISTKDEKANLEEVFQKERDP